MRKLLIISSILLLGILACSLNVQTPTVPPPPPATTTVPPTDTTTPTAAAPTPSPLPSGSGPCMAESSGGITTYTRPSYQAEVFSTVGLPPVGIGARTADGWLGFDPAKAQAANIGIFRLRWIPPGALITLSGDCASVPVPDWVPASGVCYEMVMEDVEVHVAPDANSAVSGTLSVGDFAAILGQTAAGWLYVNGDQANAPGVVGYIPEAAENVNGPCDTIPTVQ